MSSARELRARPPSRRAIRVALAALIVAWGSTWLVIRSGLEDLPALGSAAVRFAFAGAAFTLLAPRLACAEGGARPPAWLAAISGLLNVAVAYGIVYVCGERLPSGLVSVLWASFPILSAVAAHLLLPAERLERRQWCGFALGLGGVALLFLTDLRDLGPGAVPLGTLLVLSPLASAFGTTLVKRHAAGVSSVLLNRDGMGYGALFLGVAALVFERDAAWDLTPRAVGSLLYLASVGTVVSFGLYFWLIRHVGAARLSLVAYAMPVVAIVLGVSVGGEALTAGAVAGLGTIAVGVRLAGGRPSSSSEALGASTLPATSALRTRYGA